MFTGIVEELGAIVAIDRRDGSGVVTIRGPVVAESAELGDSISVSGACLTVTGTDGVTFTADVMAETLDRTSLGAAEPGDPVNLERPVPAGGRLGGHLVQGHVDGTGRIAEREPGTNWERVRVTIPAELTRYVAAKGSVAVDGVSLTVVDVGDTWFDVGLIPTTLALTTLGTKPPGATVNIEVDVLAKYVERLLSTDRRPEVAA